MISARIARRFVPAMRRAFCDAGPAVAASSGRVPAVQLRVHPPGASAEPEKAEKFADVVSGALSDGTEIITHAIGAAAAWHVLRSLCIARVAAEFEVTFGASDDGPAGKARGPRPLHVVSRQSRNQEAFTYQGGFFVANSTQSLKLARKLVVELRDSPRVTVHTFADAQSAVSTILQAIAAVPRLNGGLPLRCTAGAAKREGEEVARVVVHAEMQASASNTREGDFVAYPPGAGAEPKALQKFSNSVRERLRREQMVAMECRGKDAVTNALTTLAQVQRRTAEFQVRWSEAAGKNSTLRSLWVRVRHAEPWRIFNATDFAKTALLKVRDTTEVKTLARAIAHEVNRHGAVSVHAFREDRTALNVALKAIASAPIESGVDALFVVPSFGKSTRHSSDGEARDPSMVVRLHVRCDDSAAAVFQASKGRVWKAREGQQHRPDQSTSKPGQPKKEKASVQIKV